VCWFVFVLFGRVSWYIQVLVVVGCFYVRLGLEWGLCFVQGGLVVGWVQNIQVDWWYLQNLHGVVGYVQFGQESVGYLQSWWCRGHATFKRGWGQHRSDIGLWVR
jgi:hypothetical protein